MFVSLLKILLFNQNSEEYGCKLQTAECPVCLEKESESRVKHVVLLLGEHKAVAKQWRLSVLWRMAVSVAVISQASVRQFERWRKVAGILSVPPCHCLSMSHHPTRPSRNELSTCYTSPSIRPFPQCLSRPLFFSPLLQLSITPLILTSISI